MYQTMPPNPAQHGRSIGNVFFACAESRVGLQRAGNASRAKLSDLIKLLHCRTRCSWASWSACFHCWTSSGAATATWNLLALVGTFTTWHRRERRLFLWFDETDSHCIQVGQQQRHHLEPARPRRHLRHMGRRCRRRRERSLVCNRRTGNVCCVRSALTPADFIGLARYASLNPNEWRQGADLWMIHRRDT